MKTAEELQKDLDAATLALRAMRETQGRLIHLIADQRVRILTLEEMRDLSTRVIDRLRKALHSPVRDGGADTGAA